MSLHQIGEKIPTKSRDPIKSVPANNTDLEVKQLEKGCVGLKLVGSVRG